MSEKHYGNFDYGDDDCDILRFCEIIWVEVFNAEDMFTGTLTVVLVEDHHQRFFETNSALYLCPSVPI